jgi:hypothetical protein
MNRSRQILGLPGNVGDLAPRLKAQIPPDIASAYQPAFEISAWKHWLALALSVLTSRVYRA